MRKEMEKYNQLITGLKNAEPAMKSEEALTNQIMLHIRNNRRYKKPVHLIWIRSISSAAAILLLILFGYQYSTDNLYNTSISTHKSNHKISFSEICFSDDDIIGPIERYACYVQHQKNKKNNFQAFSKHLNSYKYENFD